MCGIGGAHGERGEVLQRGWGSDLEASVAARASRAVAKELIRTGANLDLYDDQKRTALILSIQAGHNEIALALIKAGAALDEQDAGGKTAVIIAAAMGNVACVTELVEAGASLAAQDASGQTALIAAVQRGSVAIVNVLIEAKTFLAFDAHLTLGGETALILSIQAAHKPFDPISSKIAYALIKADAAIDVQDASGQTALIVSVKTGRKGGLFPFVNELIRAGANLGLYDDRKTTALHWMCECETQLSNPLLGLRVQVYWPSERCYYEGWVDRYCSFIDCLF